jgi:hypothetical protein
MENREMHELQKLYIQETNNYLESLKRGASGEELLQQKQKIKELSQMMDQRIRHETDPSSCPRRWHK